ncbi:MAG TPA: hypothetical protein VHN20_00165, partial [Beijerinckiaceae bacterium]|nr:hypothetical protein [Beijerinckiaceae bacterium]
MRGEARAWAMASRGIKETDLRQGASHESFLRHKQFRWLKISLLACLMAIFGYALADVQPRPNGGSWYGYFLGTIATLLILWLAMIGVRKRAITSGRWSLKAWTSAHVYLGLSLVVIATLHTGFQFGWNVHTLAYALMMVVIASGIYGISVYAFLPKQLSDSSAEFTRPQMLEAIAKLDRQLQLAAQPLATAETQILQRSLNDDPCRGGLVARLTGKYPYCRTERARIALNARMEAATDGQKQAMIAAVNLL